MYKQESTLNDSRCDIKPYQTKPNPTGLTMIDYISVPK